MKINLTETTAQHYRERVKRIKDKLPRNYRKILYSHFPELKTVQGRDLIDNVLQGLKSHIQLTEILEQIARGELKLKGTVELELDRKVA